MNRSRSPLLWPVPLVLVCSSPGCSSEARVLDLEIVTGHETDAMTVEPPVANVVVTGTTPEGDVVEAEAAPGGALDFGEIDGELAYTFEVTGYDGAGTAVMRGRSIAGLVLGSVGGDTFQIFAQRLGGWARPPGELTHTHTRAPAVNVGERYLLLTGGDAAEDAAESEQYDMFAWAGLESRTFPFAARTLMRDNTDGADTVLALGSDEGNEVTVFDGGSFSNDITLPDGLGSFGEVAGGSVVRTADGRAFLVGATRLGAATDAVLDIGTDNSVTVRRLVQKRAGAAAAWLADVGLVVVGGSADGTGVEVLGEKATTFAVRPFPPDATVGAAAVAPQEISTLVLVGGAVGDAGAKTRVLDPRCTSECSANDLDLATPGVALTRVSAYALPQPGRIIVVGDEVAPSGLTRTFVIEHLMPAVTELPLREPRRGATAVDTPIGTLLLMGGVHPDGTPALTVEMFFPE